MPEPTGSDAAFEILGRIQVDLASLRASLAGAEAEVHASAERQKKTLADVANVVVAQPEEAFKAPATGATNYASQLSNLARIIKLTTVPLIAQFSTGAAQAANATAIAARSARGFGVAMGAVVTGIVLVTAVLAKFIASVKEAADTQFELEQALDKLDVGRAETQYNKATEALDRFNFNMRESAKTWDEGFSGLASGTIFRGAIASLTILTGWITGQNQQLDENVRKSAEVRKKANEAATIPAETIELQKKYAGLSKEIAQRQIAEAITATGLAAAYSALAKARNQAVITEIQDIELKKDIALAAEKDPARRVQIEDKARQDVAFVRAKAAEDERKAVVDERKAQQDRIIAAIDADLKMEGERARHAGKMAELGTELLDKERALREEEAAQRGEVLGPEGEGRRRSAELEARLKRDTEAETNAYALRRRMLVAEYQKGGAEAEKAQREIALLDRQHQDKLTEIQAEGASARSDLRKREAEDYSRTWSEVTSATSDAFKLLESAGLSSTQTQILAWEALAAAAKKGSKEQISALEEVASAQRRLQEQGKSAIEKLFDFAEKMFGKAAARRGFSLAELERAGQEMARRGAQQLGAFGAGGRLTGEQFRGAVGATEAQAQFQQQFGGRAGAAFQAAVTPPEAAFRETLGRVAGAAPFGGTDQLVALKQSWFKNFGEIEDYIAGFSGRVGDMMEQLGARLNAVVPRLGDALGREGYLQNRRGVAPTTVTP